MTEHQEDLLAMIIFVIGVVVALILMGIGVLG